MNDDVVLSALLSYADSTGRARPRLDELAELTELSESQVRRALAELCHDGRIEPVGKDGRITVFQIVSTTAGARRRRDATPKEESSSSADDRSMPRDPTPPVASRDDEPELSEEEKAERRQVGLRHAYAWLDQLKGDTLGPPDQEGGECGECGAQAHRRYSFGLFLLCRECRERRSRARAKVGERPERRPDEHEEFTPPPLVLVEAGPVLTDELAEQLAQYGSNGNGNGRSPLWDEPDF